MSDPWTCLLHCDNYDLVWFYYCYDFIACSTKEYHYPERPKFSTTYSLNGIYRRDGNDTCENTRPQYIGCCQADTDESPAGCPQRNLTSGPFTAILTFLQTSTTPSSLSITPSSASSSRSFVTSATLSPVSSSVPTETVGGQTALLAVPSVLSVPSITSVPKSTSSPSNTAAIAGGVVGGVAGLALLVGLLVIYRRRRKTKSQHGMSKGTFSGWNSGQPRFVSPSNAELHQIKQEPSTSKSLLLLHTIIRTANGVFLASSPVPPPSAPPSPLLSPLPPPPAYASYNTHSNGLEGSPDHLHPSSGSPYVAYNVPSPESPPSPPPLKTRISQQSTNSHSDGQDVSPISSHYQHQNFDNPRSMRSSVYSQVSGGVPHSHAM